MNIAALITPAFREHYKSIFLYLILFFSTQNKDIHVSCWTRRKSEKFQAVFLRLYSRNYEAPELCISGDAKRGTFDLFQTAHTGFRILLRKKKREGKWKKRRLNRMMKTTELAGILLFTLGFFFLNDHSSFKNPSASVRNLCMYP